MTAKQLERYRKQLQTLATRVAGTAAGLEEQVRAPTSGEAAGGLSNAPLHLGDLGSEAYNQELGATLLENETYIRDEALAALERVDRGTYGRCENCGEAIIPERLEALPYTRHCTPCAGKLQSGLAVNMNDGRPEGRLSDLENQLGALGSAPKDTHAAGTPGGGSAAGGLAGTNVGRGSPKRAALEKAAGSGNTDAEPEEDERAEEASEAYAASAGGAVGGTPANKRARGGKTSASTANPSKTKKPASKTVSAAKAVSSASTSVSKPKKPASKKATPKPKKSEKKPSGK